MSVCPDCKDKKTVQCECGKYAGLYNLGTENESKKVDFYSEYN